MFCVEIPDEIRKNLEARKAYSVKTFMGLPYKQTFDGEDFCILGVPYDTTTTGRPGTRFGPRAVREFLNRFGKYSQDAKWVADNVIGMDYGDIPVMLGYTLESLQLIYEGVKKVLDADVTPIVIGGDHLITYGELRAYAIEDGYLDPTHSIQVGIRGYSETYRNEYAKEHGMEVITARELHKIGIEEAAARIRKQVGTSPVIVTFDIDFLDPAAAPGTGTPVSGGFTTYEGMELIRRSIPGLDVKGFDLVEVMEDYDPGHITALAATYLITQFISVISQNKKNAE